MREIEFRGKRANGKWVCGSYIKQYTLEVGVPKTKHMIKSFYGGKMFSVDPKTVGQYTGLMDKNSKKIFEGDILYNHRVKERGQVIFLEGGFCVKYEENSLEQLCEADVYSIVVGNIHDRMELSSTRSLAPVRRVSPQ